MRTVKESEYFAGGGSHKHVWELAKVVALGKVDDELWAVTSDQSEVRRLIKQGYDVRSGLCSEPGCRSCDKIWSVIEKLQ